MDDSTVKKLVDRFLAWPLPSDVCSDLCVATKDYIFPRSGTNLLTADQAEKMIRHLIIEPFSIETQAKNVVIEGTIGADVNGYLHRTKYGIYDSLFLVVETEKHISASEIPCVVRKMCLMRGHVEYLVAYWHNGERKEVWVHQDELTKE